MQDISASPPLPFSTCAGHLGHMHPSPSTCAGHLGCMHAPFPPSGQLASPPLKDIVRPPPPPSRPPPCKAQPGALLSHSGSDREPPLLPSTGQGISPLCPLRGLLQKVPPFPPSLLPPLSLLYRYRASRPCVPCGSSSSSSTALTLLHSPCAGHFGQDPPAGAPQSGTRAAAQGEAEGTQAGQGPRLARGKGFIRRRISEQGEWWQTS